MKDFQGKRSSPFAGISGIVSYSARACVKAKNLLSAKHAGVVQLQDQAHATDLLLADLGKLPWIDNVSGKVNIIVQATRNNRKLLSRFKDHIFEYNRQVKILNSKVKAAKAEGAIEKECVDDLWSLMDEFELEDLDTSLPTRQRGSNYGSSREPGEGLTPPVQERSDIPSTRRTAVTLKKTVKTSFASCETMLEGYLRSRPVLQRLIRDPEFDRIYDAARVGGKDKRDKQFVQVIEDRNFYNQVRDVHKVLQVIRRYLRVWDAGNAQISEVVPATIMLEFALSRLKETPFFTSSKKKEVLKALERRCKGRIVGEGGTMQIKILQDVHYAAWILDPNMCPLDVTRHLPALERHRLVYLAEAKHDMDDDGRRHLAKAIVKRYKNVHRMWDTVKKGPTKQKIIESYEGFAVRYWEDESPAKSVSEHDDDPVAIDLQYFARCTLALCPSSCATERSFSHQGRIHTKQRNRLLPEVVRNLLFCKWNTRVFRNLDRLQFEMSRDAQKLKLGTFVPYEDFFNKPAFSSVFNEGETTEVLNRIAYKENRMHAEIVASREKLYEDADIYKCPSATADTYIATIRSGPSLSHSAQASTQEKSTTAFGEVSAMPLSPLVREKPGQFRAATKNELTQLLSGSAVKDTAARHSNFPRSRERLEAPKFDLNLEGVPGGVPDAARDDNEVREDDNILMPVSAIRDYIGTQLRRSQAPSAPGTMHYLEAPRNRPSAQSGQPVYLEAPMDLPSSAGPPPYVRHPGSQWPYHPTYIPPYGGPQAALSSTRPQGFAMRSASSTGYDRTQAFTPTNEPGQAAIHQPFRGLIPGGRGRGVPGTSCQVTEYPQPEQVNIAEPSNQDLRETEENDEDELV